MSDRHVHLVQGVGMDFPDECRACHDREAERDRLREALIQVREQSLPDMRAHWIARRALEGTSD